MNDLTVISRMIVDSVNKVEPLSEAQEMMIHGAIAGLAISIKQIGIDRVLSNLDNQYNRKPVEN